MVHPDGTAQRSTGPTPPLAWPKLQNLALPFGLLAHQTPVDERPSSIAPYAKVGRVLSCHLHPPRTRFPGSTAVSPRPRPAQGLAAAAARG